MSLVEKPPLDELYHYGTKRHSGRYPWGSGDEPYQHSGDFVSRVNDLRKSGLDDTQIAKHFGMSTTDFRKEYSAANDERKYLRYQEAKSLREKGYSNYKIAEMMGLPNESSVRSMLDNPHSERKLSQAKNTADFLKQQIKEKTYIDVGKDVERELNIPRKKLDEAIYLLEMEGYKVHERYVDQQTMAGQKTTYKVLCPPDTDIKDLLNVSTDSIKSIVDYRTNDDGETYQPRNVPPKSLDSKRLQIRYAEEGGVEKDGIIELRRGVEDISLGESRYAQVRILVDDAKYLKGMAVYSDDMPDGIDVIFNTNKSKDVPKMEVLKNIKDNPDNPFGSNIKNIESGGQRYYTDKDGKQQLSLINKKSDEGDWDDWSNNLPSQFLSKQPLPLAKKQLGLAIDSKKAEYEEICSLTNPTVKKRLLEDFADGCDSDAVHLKAAALPRQKYHVIIPMPSLKDNEVYAPNYDDGEQVALIRYPHGGTFEIPVLTVNNKHAAAKKLLGTDIIDAVCINSKVAERLSGADFDGDTVMVIPTGKDIKIKSTPPLKGLEGFDPKHEYGTTKIGDDYYNDQGMKIKVMKATQLEMGKISNLITDMTLLGATDEEKARAVRHSMVVIDAEKHKLDYKRSEIDNGIQALKNKYQATYNEETGRYSYGAATLISRAKGETSVLKTQGDSKINIKGEKDYNPDIPEGAKYYKVADDVYYPEVIKPGKNEPSNYKGYRLANGKKVYYDPKNKEQAEYYKPVQKVDEKTGEVYFTNKTGELIYKRKERLQASTKMAETHDATTLISKANTPMERLYADYANTMKAMANQARKEWYTTGEIEYSPSANKVYINEVNALKSRLNDALKNSPRERAAQLLADSEVNSKKQANPNMSKDEVKKIKQQAIERARASVGAKRETIVISDKEWEAIQAGAISKTMLGKILNFADMDVVRQKAMPRTKQTTLSPAQINSIKAKLKNGTYTTKQLADRYNVSTSYISNILKGKE